MTTPNTNPTPDLIARGIPKDAVKVTSGDDAILPTDYTVDHDGKITDGEHLEGLNVSDWLAGGKAIVRLRGGTDQSAVYRVVAPAPVADAREGNRSPHDVACESIDRLRAENARLAKDVAHLTREADRYKSALEKERQQRIDVDRSIAARFQPVLDAAKGAGWKPGEKTIGEFVAGLVARIAALEAVPLPADLDYLDTRLIGVAVWSAHLLTVPTAAGLDVTPEAVESVGKEMDAARAAIRALAADRLRLRAVAVAARNRLGCRECTDVLCLECDEIDDAIIAALADRGGK